MRVNGAAAHLLLLSVRCPHTFRYRLPARVYVPARGPVVIAMQTGAGGQYATVKILKAKKFTSLQVAFNNQCNVYALLYFVSF